MSEGLREHDRVQDLIRAGKVAHIVDPEPGQTEPRPGQKALCGFAVRGIPAPPGAPCCIVCEELSESTA